MAEYSGATIGLIAQGSMGHALGDHLKHGKFGNARFVDATELVDNLMVIKSDEEIALIRATAHLQDRAMRAAFDAIKPGMRDIEVTQVAETYTRNAGAEYGLLMGASSPIGVSVMIQPRHLQNRVVNTTATSSCCWSRPPGRAASSARSAAPACSARRRRA